jgi:hypothetical protein
LRVGWVSGEQALSLELFVTPGQKG